MTNLDRILKSRDITLPTKVHLVNAILLDGFSSSHVWMRELDYKESWAPKNWCFWTCWRNLLRVPWTISRSNQSILKEIRPENHWKDWCWSWNSNTLATCWEELTYWIRPWCWERLKAGGEGDDRGWDGWMASSTQWTWVWVGSGSWWWTGKPGMPQSMGWQRVGQDWATELNWMQKSRRCKFSPWVRKIPWRGKWQPTSVFLSRESHRQRSLAGYTP